MRHPKRWEDSPSRESIRRASGSDYRHPTRPPKRNRLEERRQLRRTRERERLAF